MKALVIGSSGKIGAALLKALKETGHEAIGIPRQELDLLAIPDGLGAKYLGPDVVYLCAAKSRFIDCEADPDTYRINVDAQIDLARQFGYAKIVYLSSEAVERALHTNYGMQKALAEMGLRAVCEPVIARLSKVDPDALPAACAWLAGLATAKPGVHRWHA